MKRLKKEKKKNGLASVQEKKEQIPLIIQTLHYFHFIDKNIES